MAALTSLSEQARALSQTVGVRLREDLIVVRVSGDDARTWLSGQVTNDMREIAPGRGVYALAVSVRGKIIADVWIFDRGDALALLVPESAHQALLESFERQIIMEDVVLSVDHATKAISLLGPQAPSLVAGAALEPRDAHAADELGAGGALVLAASTHAETFAELVQLAEAVGGGAVSLDAYELARLRAGRGRFGSDFGDQNYPQEAGLQARAVSFNKGCYLGQEVVCTLENRGRLNRQLMRLQAADALVPQAGAELHDTSGQLVGHVTSAAWDPDLGHALALGYIKRAQANAGAQLHAGAVVLTVLEACA